MDMNVKEMNTLQDARSDVSDISVMLTSLTEQDWQEANYPIVSFAPKKTLTNYLSGNSKRKDTFWKEVFNPEHYLTAGSSCGYNPETDFIFILHSFPNEGGQDCRLKAVTTTHSSILENPQVMINYKYHGKPCENRSNSSYPECDFWIDFYDRLSSEDKDIYPIPDTNWRKNFIMKNILKK